MKIPHWGNVRGEGNSGNTIDVAFDTHEEALQFGRKNLELYILD